MKYRRPSIYEHIALGTQLKLIEKLLPREVVSQTHSINSEAARLVRKIDVSLMELKAVLDAEMFQDNEFSDTQLAKRVYYGAYGKEKKLAQSCRFDAIERYVAFCKLQGIDGTVVDTNGNELPISVNNPSKLFI